MNPRCCSTLADLPSPPRGKEGWPWTKETKRARVELPHGRPWPLISVVTPSYNQGQFIEETIRSVLLQGYPNLEYIIIDGGSTDNTLEVLESYRPWLTYSVSEPDGGQAHGINKGLDRATGRIAAYLNSDDVYMPGALQHVGTLYAQTGFDVLVGRTKQQRRGYSVWRRSWWKKGKPFVFPFILELGCRYELSQESVFWNHSKYHALRMDESFQFCLDVWWFTRVFSGAKVLHSTRPLGYFRHHPASKSARLHELGVRESQALSSTMLPYTYRVSTHEKRKIVSSYKRASVLAQLTRLLMPWRECCFAYYHPSYLTEEPANAERFAPNL